MLFIIKISIAAKVDRWRRKIGAFRITVHSIFRHSLLRIERFSGKKRLIIADDSRESSLGRQIVKLQIPT